MTRCKQCLTRAESLNGCCPVCGVAQDKALKSLSPAERKVRLHAHGIRLVAMVHLIVAAMAILMMPEFPKPAAIAVLAVINGWLAYGLIRFSLIAYRAAVVFYFFLGMVNVISIQQGAIHFGGIALALIALYLVGNRTAKAIFERQCPELLSK
jgi:hypothetical protein